MSGFDLAANREKVSVRDPLDQTAAPLMRPRQVAAAKQKIAGMDASIRNANKPYGGTASVGEARRAMARMKGQVEDQAPRPYSSDELPEAIKAEADLREKIQAGMPTGEEMRKNPPGVVGKHMAWQKRRKKDVIAWQNIRLRLQASGALKGDDVDAGDVASVERLRKHHSNYQASMDGAQVRGNGVGYYFPDQIEPRNLMSDAEREASDAETRTIVQILQSTKDPAERKAALLKHLG